MDYRYFIFDCEDRIVGNPKGYETARGASRQANTRKLQNLVWERFYARQDKDKVRVWEIHCLRVKPALEV
jgi:hypothetical protein